MERNREARRGTMAAMNGGLTRRRQRSSGLRESPEDDGGMEMHETTRLRDRGSKKDRDRDRDRSSRSKRRRGERMLHGSNRDDGEDSSEESLDEEEDDEEDEAAVAVRLPPAPLNPAPAPAPSTLTQNHHHHHRKSFPAKPVRVPPWKAADEIGVPIPKKARSASAKRSHESWVSGGGGEQIQRQPSTSPSRLSPVSTAQISPTSSNVSARKKMKPISGNKQRPPKVSKPSSTHEQIEMEIAEVLSKLRKPEAYGHRLDSKDTNGSSNEVKFRVSSPNSVSPPPASLPSVLPPSNLSTNAPLTAVAPKRKRPRPVDENPTSPVSSLALPSTSVSSAAKMDTEQPKRSDATSPKSEKAAPSPAGENGGGSIDFSAPQAVSVPGEIQQESGKPENLSVLELIVPAVEPDCRDRVEAKQEVASPKEESSHTDLDEASAAKVVPTDESHQEEKFTIDLMSPPGKSSPERDSLCDFVPNHRPVGQQIELVATIDDSQKEGEATRKMMNQNAGESLMDGRMAEKSIVPEAFDLKKQMAKGKTLDLQLDLEKLDNLGGTKHQLPKQQSKASRVEPQLDKTVTSSLPMPMTVASWPGGFPQFGYMGQVPPLQQIIPTMDAATGSSATLQPQNFLPPPVRPRRCATHCYIAKIIQYHQRTAQMNPFWPAAAGTPPLYGAKPYNLNVLPPLESALLGNPLQGSFPGRSLGSLQDNKGPPIVAAFTGHPGKEKISTTNGNIMEAAQRKQLVLQQTTPQPGSASNMLQGPAFIFPLNQHPAVAAAAAAAVRSGVVKSTTGVGNAAVPPGPSGSVAACSGPAGPAAAINFGYAMPPNDAQYLAILQNSGYTFPFPAHVGGPPTYRGGTPAQGMPFFSGSFFSPQMLHPSQLQQQQPAASVPQQAPHAQQGHQNTSPSSGSSSSQKHPQQQPQRVLGAGASGAGLSSHSLPSTKKRSQLQLNQVRQLESETGCEDSPSTADSRVSQAQKSLYGHNLGMPIHAQNIALMPTAAAGLSSGGVHSEKQPRQQQQPAIKVDLTPSQASFAMSFASINGGAAPLGLDFSSMAQNHALFQSLPDAARHGYHQVTTASAAATAQHKKGHPQTVEDGKSAGDSSMNANNAGVEERKMMASTSKSLGVGGSQHSLTFPKPDSECLISSIPGNSFVDNNFQAMDLIPASANGSGTSNRMTNSAASPTTAVPTVPANPPNFQLQKQVHLHHQLASTRTKSSASSNNANVYSERLTSGSTMTKFPQTLTGFPQGLIQGGSPVQSPQWKPSGRSGTPAPPPSADPLVAKNHIFQQHGRAAQQSLVTPSHQTQISFGANSLKSAPAGAQHLSGGGTSNVPASSTGVAAAAVAVGSPSNSVSKSTGGSPRASTSAKPSPPAHLQQSSTKSSASSSCRKSSPNRNAPSILGHPQHISSATNSSTSKQLPQLQQYRLQPPFLQNKPQLYFSNAAYMQAQAPPQSSAAATANYYRRQSEQQQQLSQQQHQKQSSNPVSAAMLALCSSGLTLAGSSAASDSAKAAAAASNSMKGLPPPGLLHAAHLSSAAAQSAASGAPHPLMSAAAVASAAFPYMSMPPPVSAKPGDQKPATGNDNLNAYWQPEKRS